MGVLKHVWAFAAEPVCFNGQQALDPLSLDYELRGTRKAGTGQSASAFAHWDRAPGFIVDAAVSELFAATARVEVLLDYEEGMPIIVLDRMGTLNFLIDWLAGDGPTMGSDSPATPAGISVSIESAWA